MVKIDRHKTCFYEHSLDIYRYVCYVVWLFGFAPSYQYYLQQAEVVCSGY